MKQRNDPCSIGDPSVACSLVSHPSSLVLHLPIVPRGEAGCEPLVYHNYYLVSTLVMKCRYKTSLNPLPAWTCDAELCCANMRGSLVKSRIVAVSACQITPWEKRPPPSGFCTVEIGAEIISADGRGCTRRSRRTLRRRPRSRLDTPQIEPSADAEAGQGNGERTANVTSLKNQLRSPVPVFT